MSLPPMRLLLEALTQPASIVSFSLADWDVLIRQARAADSLARLGGRIQAAELVERVPVPVWRHLQAALLLSTRQHTELAYEVRAIARALQPQSIPLVLLKGAAYAAAGLNAAQGRMVSDVDILVPRERLADAESALMKAGWLTSTRDAYDQQYYRQWMHEIPALRHVQRGSVLDVHHSVVPPTAGYGLNSRLLLDAAVVVDGVHDIRVLSDVDMVLHSAVHLMHEGELDLGFRGLLDLDALLNEFSQRDAFWLRLVARAQVLDLQRPAFLGLRYTNRLIGTKVPAEVLDDLRRAATTVQPWRLQALDALYDRALRPVHPTLSDRWTGLARQLIYMRSHALRMPMYLLVPHLTRKSVRRMLATFKKEGESDATT